MNLHLPNLSEDQTSEMWGSQKGHAEECLENIYPNLGFDETGWVGSWFWCVNIQGFSIYSNRPWKQWCAIAANQNISARSKQRCGSAPKSKSKHLQDNSTSKICGLSQVCNNTTASSCKRTCSNEVSCTKSGNKPNSKKRLKHWGSDLQWKQPKRKKCSSCSSQLDPRSKALRTKRTKLRENGATDRRQRSSWKKKGEWVWKKSAKQTAKFCISVAIPRSSSRLSTSHPKKRRVESAELSRVWSKTGRQRPKRSFKTR